MFLTDKQLAHRQYLQSPVWKAKRTEAIGFYGSVCSRCGEHGTDVHHRTYARVGGRETMADLEVMCRPCHEAHHAAERCANAGNRKPNSSKPVNQLAIWRLITPRQKAILRTQFTPHTPLLGEIYTILSFGNPSCPAVKAALAMLGKTNCTKNEGLHPTKTKSQIRAEKRLHKMRQRVNAGVHRHDFIGPRIPAPPKTVRVSRRNSIVVFGTPVFDEIPM